MHRNIENLESADAAFNQFKSFPVGHSSGALFARHNFTGLHMAPADAAALGFMPMNDRLRLVEYDHTLGAIPSHMTQVSFRSPVMNSLMPHGHPAASMIKSDDPFLHSSVACSSGLIGASDQFLYPAHQGFPGNFTAMLNDGEDGGLCGLPNIQTMIHGVRSSGGAGGFPVSHHALGVSSSAYHDMGCDRPTYIPESSYPIDTRGFMAEDSYKAAIAASKNSAISGASHSSGFLERAASVQVSQMLTSILPESSNLANNCEKSERKRSRHTMKMKESSRNDKERIKCELKADDLQKIENCAEYCVPADRTDTLHNNLNNPTSDTSEKENCASAAEAVLDRKEEKNCRTNDLTTTDVSCIDVGQDDIVKSKSNIEICAVELKRETVDISEAADIEAAIEPIISDVQTSLMDNDCMNLGDHHGSRELDNQCEGVASVWGAVDIGGAISETEQSEGLIDKHKYVDKLDVNVHVEDHQCIVVDGVRRWRCIQCPKIYSTKHNLIIHILGHSGIKPHCCVICNKYFKQISHLQTHMLRHGNVKPHICHICNRSFTQASHVKRHMSVHMERRPHVCQECDRSFAYPCELRTHMERHKTEHTCDECHETYETNEKLRKHKIMEHRDSSALMCKVCSKVFMYPSQLRDHMAKHDGSRPYICGDCGLDFMKEHHLKAHMFIHTGLRPYQCKQCAKTFNQKANLQRHMLIHTGEKKFACEVCGRGFTQHQVLRAHLITHQDTKPFLCKICGKGFSRLHNLNGHMHIHEGDKPFVCQCGAAFTLKGNLNRHQKDKHVSGECDDITESELLEEVEESYEQTERLEQSVSGEEKDSIGHRTTRQRKKKRKSMPRKTQVLPSVTREIVHIEEDVATAWNLTDTSGPALEDDNDDDDDTIIGDDDDVALALSPVQQKLQKLFDFDTRHSPKKGAADQSSCSINLLTQSGTEDFYFYV